MSLSDSFRGMDPLQDVISDYFRETIDTYPHGRQALQTVTDTILDVLNINHLIPTDTRQRGPCNRLVRTVLGDLFSIMNTDVQGLVASDSQDREKRCQEFEGEWDTMMKGMNNFFDSLSDDDRQGVVRLQTKQLLQRAADSVLKYDMKLAAQMGTALADKDAIKPVYAFMRELAENIFTNETIHNIAQEEWIPFCESSEDPCDPKSPGVVRDIQDTMVHATCTVVCEKLIDQTIDAINKNAAGQKQNPTMGNGPGF